MAELKDHRYKKQVTPFADLTSKDLKSSQEAWSRGHPDSNDDNPRAQSQCWKPLLNFAAPIC